MMTVRSRLILVGVLVGVPLIAIGVGRILWGPKSGEEFAEPYREGYERRRGKLRRIAAVLAKPAASQPRQTDTSPAIPRDGRLYTTVWYEHLDDPELQGEAAPKLYRRGSDALLAGFRMLKQLKGREVPGHEEDSTRRVLEDGLACRYLIVHRTASLTEPKLTGEPARAIRSVREAVEFALETGGKGQYQAGRARIENFVVDLESERVIARYQFEVANSASLEVTGSETLLGALWRDLRQNTAKAADKAFRQALRWELPGAGSRAGP